MADPNYKYDEGAILAEIKEYIDSTYGAHYVGSDNIQALDLIAAGGMLMQFAASSIIKYTFRFGKKDGFNRKDVLKVIHYAIFILWELNKKQTQDVSSQVARDIEDTNRKAYDDLRTGKVKISGPAVDSLDRGDTKSLIGSNETGRPWTADRSR